MDYLSWWLALTHLRESVGNSVDNFTWVQHPSILQTGVEINSYTYCSGSPGADQIAAHSAMRRIGEPAVITVMVS